ncbi:death domain-associated protein [Halorubellus sp. JP-L1]|uniref:DUF5786 family protein n=1 Tax=Halorubellus sp. JP-L1 TaxID=2715753 RepID=UPI00140E6D9B|nr:DUF5786 family protein [Halorubellus sp. JP-L1]NHN42145.1 death domain-associated protein [Halorubellus sp. JP-L1]
MGFGSYDESEQDTQEIDTDLDEDTVDGRESDHEGEVEFENGASNDELLDRLEDIKSET